MRNGICAVLAKINIRSPGIPGTAHAVAIRTKAHANKPRHARTLLRYSIQLTPYPHTVDAKPRITTKCGQTGAFAPLASLLLYCQCPKTDTHTRMLDIFTPVYLKLHGIDFFTRSSPLLFFSVHRHKKYYVYMRRQHTLFLSSGGWTPIRCCLWHGKGQ